MAISENTSSLKNLSQKQNRYNDRKVGIAILFF